MIHLEFDRRNFMRVGGISAGLSTIGLTDIQGADAPSCLLPNDKSVIWIWLGGGATQVDTTPPPAFVPPLSSPTVISAVVLAYD